MNAASAEPGPRSQVGQRRFPLLRYFSIAALICTIITAVAMGAVYRQHEVNELMEQAQREHAAFARVVSFTLRSEVAALLDRAGDAAASAEFVARIDRMIRDPAAYFGAAKVKIYTPAGLTVFSTRPSEIGRNDENNPGVVRALRGQITSSLVHRDQFNAFDRVIENRDLLQTYLPVPGPGRDRVIGVFELYSDMTGLLARIRETERWVMASIAGTLLLLYGVLFLIVRRADTIIKVQDGALQAQMREISRHNVALEVRVQERTAALEEANRQLRGEISEREAAQRELERARQHAWQQEKLAAIGRLAAGIVHEIGNPLAAVRGLVDTASEDLAGHPAQDLGGPLQQIKDHIRRLESITHDVTGFSVPEAREPELVNLNELLTHVAGVMLYDVKSRGVEIVMELDHELPAITGVPDQLWQVVMNLVLNAADAIEGRTGAPRTITLGTRPQGAFALLTVCDAGVGMSEEAVARAFEPFQTTKAAGKGMGIGLSVCHAFVRQHGGDIQIASRPGEGTTVSVTLPLATVPLATVPLTTVPAS